MPSRHSFVRSFWYVRILRCTLARILIFTCKNPPVPDTVVKLSLFVLNLGVPKEDVYIKRTISCIQRCAYA